MAAVAPPPPSLVATSPTVAISPAPTSECGPQQILDFDQITLLSFIAPSFSRTIPSVMSQLDVISRIDWAYHATNRSSHKGGAAAEAEAEVETSRRQRLPDATANATAATTTDAGDESLQRYKQSLGLGQGKDLSDPNDPRVCIIQSLTMEAPGRDPVTIDLSTPGSENTLKDKPFKIKEGAKFTMVATFRVQHEILSGLHYVQVVKRKGIKVSKDSEMIGSYAPNTDKQPIYTKKFHEEEAPSGMLARGHYNAISSFVDDDKKKHLEFEWSFDIAKDW